MMVIATATNAELSIYVLAVIPFFLILLGLVISLVFRCLRLQDYIHEVSKTSDFYAENITNEINHIRDDLEKLK